MEKYIDSVVSLPCSVGGEALCGELCGEVH